MIDVRQGTAHMQTQKACAIFCCVKFHHYRNQRGSLGQTFPCSLKEVGTLVLNPPQFGIWYQIH